MQGCKSKMNFKQVSSDTCNTKRTLTYNLSGIAMLARRGVQAKTVYLELWLGSRGQDMYQQREGGFGFILTQCCPREAQNPKNPFFWKILFLVEVIEFWNRENT